MGAVSIVFITVLVGIIYGGLVLLRFILGLPYATELLAAAVIIGLLRIQWEGDPDEWIKSDEHE